jgi:acyl-CoA thioesterase-1
MGNPIWRPARGRGAARSVHYSLALAFASLLVAAVAGCSPDAGTPGSAETGASTPSTAASAAAPMAGDQAGGATDPAGGARGGGASRPEGEPVVLFLGTSLTAGYGLPESQAYPALLQERIDAAGLDYRVVNAGVSGDTSAGGLRRLDWLLRLPVAVLVVELGANDMLRGLGVEQLRRNLDRILERTAATHPDARFVVAGMRAAPNLGRDYVEAFDATYPALAEAHDAALVPFLLEDVAARPELNQADGIHPTAEGHALIAERIWPVLRPLLR